MALRKLLEPKKLAPISRMELVARQVVEGFVVGKHTSPFHGSSAEYAGHRPYTIGDELRSMDWKLLAKTDRYYVKLFADQTNARCTILVDNSKSMAFGTGIDPPGVKKDGPLAKPKLGTKTSAALKAAAAPPNVPATPITKLDYAFQLAASLGYLMIKQNDSIGLAVVDHEVKHYFPPRATASHFRHLVTAMESAQPGGDSQLAKVMHEIATRISRRGIVIIISDLLDDPKAVSDALAHFRHEKHEVIVFHVMDPAEIHFPYDKLTRFKDAEGATTIVAHPRSVRQAYLDRLAEFCKAIRRACHEQDVSYCLAPTSTPYDQLLMAYLEQRLRLKA